MTIKEKIMRFVKAQGNQVGSGAELGEILDEMVDSMPGPPGPQGPQGPQGNTGSSVDYPYELVNNLTTDDPEKGLSAAQGVALKGEISQLGLKVDNSRYQRLTKIEGEGNTFKEVSIGEFDGGQKVFCTFEPWPTASAAQGGYIFRIRKVLGGVYSDVYGRQTGQSIPQSYEFIAESGAKYFFGGRADVGSYINGVFTYNCIDSTKLNNIVTSLSTLDGNLNSLNTELSKVEETIEPEIGVRLNLPCPKSDWNIYPMTISQGDIFRLTSSILRECYTLSSTTSSSSEYRLDWIYLSANNKKEFKATQDAVAIMFYGVGNVLLKKLGDVDTALEVIGQTLDSVLIEKTNSLPGLGNNTFAGPKNVGNLTPGHTYLVYVNDYSHESASSGYLFAIYKNGTIIFTIDTSSQIPTDTPIYTFVAEEGATYGFGGRCDIGDSIDVEFLTREKASIDENEVIGISNNAEFHPLLQEVLFGASLNSKIGNFLHVTDMHSNFNSLQALKAFKDKFNLSVSAILNGGDNVSGWPLDAQGNLVPAISTYMDLALSTGLFHVLGQHEVGFAPSADPSAVIGRTKLRCMTHEQCFNTYISPLKNTWGLSELDKCYFYKDFSTANGSVRLIVLYQYNRPEVTDPNDASLWKYQRALVWYGTEQLQWFANTLNSMSAGQVAIVFCHQPTKTFAPMQSSKFQGGFNASVPNNITSQDPISEIIAAYKNKSTLVRTYTPTDTTKYLIADGFEESVNADFSSAVGKVGFMLSGDNHFDCVGMLSVTTTTSDEPGASSIAASILQLCLTSCGAANDGVVTQNTGYSSDYIINAFGLKTTAIELGRIGQQFFVGKKRDIEMIYY